jgi:hypothetical protein
VELATDFRVEPLMACSLSADRNVPRLEDVPGGNGPTGMAEIFSGRHRYIRCHRPA